MRHTKKIAIVVGNDGSKLRTKEAFGYDLNIPCALRLLSMPSPSGWQIFDKKSGLCVSGGVPFATEDEAIDFVVSCMNQDGIDKMQEEINRVLTSIRDTPDSSPAEEIPAPVPMVESPNTDTNAIAPATSQAVDAVLVEDTLPQG